MKIRSRTALALTLLAALPLSALAVSGCALGTHPTQRLDAAPASMATWAEVFAAAPMLEHEAVVSARWQVPTSGVLNLEHPAARAAHIEDGDTPIVLPVHVLRHRDRGTFIIDTGVPAAVQVKGLVSSFTGDIEVVEPVSAIIARQPQPLAGVLMTHLHLDHVLGLPDIDPKVPVMVGPGEQGATSIENALTRSTYDALFDGRAPLRVFDFTQAQSMGPITHALDVLGDGSLWALHMPGHTAGTVAYVAQTTTGPMLFTGDVSHTLWGFEHGVEPGSYTADHAENGASLEALRALRALFPAMQVFVGHETDGVGTGIAAK